MVTERDEVFRSATFPKDKLLGFAEIENVATEVAVPARATVTFATELEIATDPVKVPELVGVKLTGMLAEPPAGIEIGNVRTPILKPAPLTVAALTDTDELPVFESVRF